MNRWLLLFCLILPVLGAPKRFEIKDEDSDNELEQWCEGKPADIFFLLDTSSSINFDDFDKQKAFVQDLIKVFDISETKTRIAVALFSSGYYSQFPFYRYNDKSDIINAIDRIRHRGGNTETGRAIGRMVRDGFRFAREGVVRIAFVLTDGKSQRGDVTIAEAAKAKEDNIFIYAIGVGKADIDELNAIGSDPKSKFVHKVGSYSVLHQLKDDLAATVCKIEPQKMPPCGYNQPTDLMYVFDSSAMGAAKARKIYQFISNTSEHFSTESEGNIRTGVLSRHCPNNDIALNSYQNKQELIDELNKPKLHGLEHLVKKVTLESFADDTLTGSDQSSSASKAMVLFVDNETEKLEKVLEQAKEAQKKNIAVYVVNISSGKNNIYVEMIASEPFNQHTWNVNSYDDLDTIKMKLINRFC